VQGWTEPAGRAGLVQKGLPGLADAHQPIQERYISLHFRTEKSFFSTGVVLGLPRFWVDLEPTAFSQWVLWKIFTDGTRCSWHNFERSNTPWEWTWGSAHWEGETKEENGFFVRGVHWAVCCDPNLCLPTLLNCCHLLEPPQLLFETASFWFWQIRSLGVSSRGPTPSGHLKLVELAVKGDPTLYSIENFLQPSVPILRGCQKVTR